ncbi:MAG: hypothetical protein RL033_5999 [Pseudomonadota bacterium]
MTAILHASRLISASALLAGVGALCLAAACHPSEPKAPAAEVPSAAAPSAAPTGAVRVLTADTQVLQRPTTAAFRGQSLFVAIGQLSVLFGSDGAQPVLPFQALSLPLEGGTLGAEKIALPGADYYPEGTAAAEDGTLFIGSIMQGTIVKVPAGSLSATPFVSKPLVQRGVIGLTVDAGRQLLWFCDSNPKLEESKKAGELVGVQLSDGKEIVRHALARGEDKAPFCNDVIVSPDGALWITDSAVGRVFHVPSDKALQANSAEAWAEGDEVRPPPTGGSGANGLEWVDGKLVVANVGRGTLVWLDPTSTEPSRGAQLIALSDASSQQPIELCSPDGVERVPGSQDKVVVVENGGCPTKQPRIVEVTLHL